MSEQLPTFDEWYESKNGHTWESQQVDGKLIYLVMRELSRDMRDYVSEMVRDKNRTRMRTAYEQEG